jgi:hypothetical protein
VDVQQLQREITESAQNFPDNCGPKAADNPPEKVLHFAQEVEDPRPSDLQIGA